MDKYVYSFDEGNKDMRELLGGKGANLAEMSALGLPVPRGFTITTAACNEYYNAGKTINDAIKEQVRLYLKKLENVTGKNLGSTDNPLLVSVRSGAPASMPGMMDTILNLGLNDDVVEALAMRTGNRRFAYDSYRRFIMMYSDVVMENDRDLFEGVIREIKSKKGVKYDSELNASDMVILVQAYKKIYYRLNGREFPKDPQEQLIHAIEAVFRSWNNERAIIYREMNNIPSSWGTAVNVQEMVYGNMGDLSGTGVAFTRNPATGENVLYGEYLINAQGEDVVAGIRTPKSIDTLKDIMPNIYEEFKNISRILEEHYKDVQDMEFTIENGKLFMLQTRNAKRTGVAAIKSAVDMVREGLITKEEAILKVDANTLDQLLHDTFDEEELKRSKVIGHGLPASPGAGYGKIYFNAKDLKDIKDKEAILVRVETSPEDIEGMRVANGILTVMGGMTSHAAVVARGMGKCCITGCNDIVVDASNKQIHLKDGSVLNEGDYISINGSTGKVYLGKLATVEATISADFKLFMEWVDQFKRLGVRANADTPRDAILAKKFGAEGIGLCRTEHMFFDEKRIFNFRKMILSDSVEERKLALDDILPFQRADFEGLFRAMQGAPVIIRYLDPPLHEFLPKTNDEINKLANSLKLEFSTLKSRIDALHEFNPMMGHRGCRLAVTYPEIAVMQTKALIEAAINVQEEGIKVTPEIMIPLTTSKKEFDYVREIVCKEAERIISERGVSLDYSVGTMIETPRACIMADDIARDAEFFSFGTNDLTQLTFGFSRDDASKFIGYYKEKNILESDPFLSIDQDGVGKLVELAIKKGKSVRKDISLGICGEHGGEVQSIYFADKIGLDYVSCSPYRVPIASLAAAQAAIKSWDRK